MSDPVAVPRKLVVRFEGLENPIGMLEDASDGSGYRIRFVYARGYRGPAPSASMPPRTDPYEDAAARAFFDNLPPEGARRRNVVPGKTAGARPFDEDDVVGLLSVLGRECPGAVMVIPEEAPPPKVPGVLGRDYAPLTDQEVERMLRAAAAGIETTEGDRVSLPRVQRKVALSYVEASALVEARFAILNRDLGWGRPSGPG